MQRVLVTGATGFVGKHLMEHLAQSSRGPYQIIGTHFSQLKANGERLPEGIELVSLDLADAKATHDLIADAKPSHIIHLAALSSPKQSFEEPMKTIENNVGALMAILEGVRHTNHELQSLVIIGSAEQYGYIQSELESIDEEVAFHPVSPYAVSKVACDMLGYQYYKTYGVPVVRLRPFNHTGPGQDGRFVIPAFAEQVVAIEQGRQEPVMRVGNTAAIRDFTDVRDMVVAYELAMHEAERGKAYNLGSGLGISIQEVLEMMLSLAKVTIQTSVDPARFMPIDVPRLVADTRSFRKATGWNITIPLKKTLSDVLDYCRSTT